VGLIIRFMPLLLKGVVVTIEVTAASAVLALIMSFVGGLGRLDRHSLVRWIAGGYIELFRGTSLIVQLFWVYYVFPMFGVSVGPFTAGVAVLGLNLGAYGAEVVRGGIQAVPAGQTDAAVALNFPSRQRFIRIVLPQAVPLMLPSFGNLLIVLLKASSLVSLVTLADLTFDATNLQSTYGHTVLIFSIVLVLYFVMSSVLTVGMHTVETRVAVRQGIRMRKRPRLFSSQAGWPP
jgi:polar amino acid transport system permease protein